MHSLMVRPEAMQSESARHSRRAVFCSLQLEDILVQEPSRPIAAASQCEQRCLGTTLSAAPSPNAACRAVVGQCPEIIDRGLHANTIWLHSTIRT